MPISIITDRNNSLYLSISFNENNETRFPRTKGAEDLPWTKNAEDFPRTQNAEDFTQINPGEITQNFTEQVRIKKSNGH